MSYDWMWFQTSLPKEVVRLVAQDALKLEEQAESSQVFHYKQGSEIDKKKRSSRNAWIPATHWITGFLMHYANIANNENYHYDLIGVDSHRLQYGIYGVNDHYYWHADYSTSDCQKFTNNQSSGLHQDRVNQVIGSSSELVRKLSFSLQLTESSEYEGGQLEIMCQGGKIETMTREFGEIIFFDSRVMHRVTPVTKGERRSIVGWIVGPRWK